MWKFSADNQESSANLKRSRVMMFSVRNSQTFRAVRTFKEAICQMCWFRIFIFPWGVSTLMSGCQIQLSLDLSPVLPDLNPDP